jgi:CheY-like chemotaxis protein
VRLYGYEPEEVIGRPGAILFPPERSDEELAQPKIIGLLEAAPDAIVAVGTAIREVGRRILENHGHRVMVADDGMDAIRLARSLDGPLDLLLTDVVMPQVLGKDLAEAARAARPEVKILYMSGYASPSLTGTGRGPAGALPAFTGVPINIIRAS